MSYILHFLFFIFSACFASAQIDTSAAGLNMHVNNNLRTEVVSTNKFMLVNGTEGCGNILMSSQDGCALWVAPDSITLLRGKAGATGAQGVTGIQGIQGITGLNGSNGSNGSNGVTGITGTQGVSGNQGNTGPTGSTGIAGVTGQVGPTGAQGTIGSTGVQGATGVTGSAGTNGTNGSNGVTGAQGITGVTGTAGSNGTNGVTGATGVGAVYYTRVQGSAPTTYTAVNYTSIRNTNSSGVINDTLTTTGTQAGTALFPTSITSIQVSGKYGGTAVTIPLQAYTLSADKKTIIINVGTGTVLGLLGATVLSIGSGQEESIHIIGY